MIGGQIYIATYAALGVILMALMAKYVLPLISGILTNSDRTRVRKTAGFKPVIHARSQPFGAKSAPTP
jgi:hypothetical protein